MMSVRSSIVKNTFRDPDIKRILIRSTNWVGDTVMTMPAFEAARKIFPQSAITVLAKPWVAPLFENHPAIDEVILYRTGDGYIKGIKASKKAATTEEILMPGEPEFIAEKDRLKNGIPLSPGIVKELKALGDSLNIDLTLTN